MLNPGELLGDRYRLQGRIAGGGMGDVWRATDTVLARLVAIKVLESRGAGDATFGARFRAEARTMAALRHPGVVEVYDYGEGGGSTEPGVSYLVMAYVDGEPLADRIAASGPLSAEETMSVVAQAADALDAAHAAGVVHRDVKPGNLLIQPDGTVVLVDFGVARCADAAALTGSNEVVGTALYMAPEQITKSDITPATDIYALGVVAYHCLAGHPPFMGANPLTVALSHLNDDPPPLPDGVPPAVGEVVARAMAKAPADRFPSAAAVAATARAAIADPAAVPASVAAPAAARTQVAEPASARTRVVAPLVPPPVVPPPVPAGAVRPARRRAVTAAVAAVLGLAALAVVLAFAQPAVRSPRTDQRPGAPPAPSASVKPIRSASGVGGGPGTVRSSGQATPSGRTAGPSGGAAGPAGGPGEATAPAGPRPTPPPSDDPPAPTATATAEPTPSAPAASVDGPAGSSPLAALR